jgi:hypothetical protein
MKLPRLVRNQSMKAVPHAIRGKRKAHTGPFHSRKRTIPNDVRRAIRQMVPEKSPDIPGAQEYEDQVKETSRMNHKGKVLELDLLTDARYAHRKRSSVVLHELVQMFVVRELSSRSEALDMFRDKHGVVLQEMKKDFVLLELTRASHRHKEGRQKSGIELEELRRRLLVKGVRDARWRQACVSKHHHMVNITFRDLTDRSISHNEITRSFQLALSELTKREALQRWTKTHQERRQLQQSFAAVLDEVLQTAALRRSVEESKTQQISRERFNFVLQELVKLDGRSMTQREAGSEKNSGSTFHCQEELMRLSQMIQGHAKKVQHQLLHAFALKGLIQWAGTPEHHHEQYCAALKEMSEKFELRKLEERSKEVNVTRWKASQVLRELKDCWDLLEIEGLKQLLIEDLSDMCKALESFRKRKNRVHHELSRAFAMTELVQWVDAREHQRKQYHEVLREMGEQVTVQDMMLRSTEIDSLPQKALVKLHTLTKRGDWQENEESDEFPNEQLSTVTSKSNQECRERTSGTKKSFGAVRQAETLILQELNEKLDWVSVSEPNSGKLEYVEVGDRKEWVVC